MRSARYAALLPVLAAVLLAGCNESPFTPPPAYAGSWTETDIGGAWPQGTASGRDGGRGWVLQGNGMGMQDASDSFTFQHVEVSGNVAIAARVADVQNMHPGTAAGVMLRAGLDDDAVAVGLTLTPADGVRLRARTVAGDDALLVGGDPAAAPPCWLRLQRTGTTVTAFVSADGVAWKRVASLDLALPDTLDVGLTASSHDDATLATAVFRDTHVVTGAAVGGQVDRPVGREPVGARPVG